MKLSLIFLLSILTFTLYSQCEISFNGDAWYVGIPFQSSINYCPPSMSGIGSCMTWETEIASPLYTGIRKKYQWRILSLQETTSLQLNIGYSFQNFGGGFNTFSHQTLEELLEVMNEDYSQFLFSPIDIPLPRRSLDFFIMSGCPHEEDSEIIVSSKFVGYPVDYMYFENQQNVSRCLSGIAEYIDVRPWNRGIKVGLTLPPGEYWIYVGFEIENGISNWGWIQWSLTTSLTPCLPDVFFPGIPFEFSYPPEPNPLMGISVVKNPAARYKKVILMEGQYRGILLYDELEDRYYDFLKREVKLY